MAGLFDERAPDRYFIKPLNDDGDSLQEEECLPGVTRLELIIKIIIIIVNYHYYYYFLFLIF